MEPVASLSNHRTRIRDQERGPIAADLRIMREKSKSGEATFALSADVTEAHRQAPISRQDWHLRGCQVQPGGDVFVNTVGTFGVALASYYWSTPAIGRLCQYIPGSSASSWHLLVADYYHLGGLKNRAAIICFFVLCSVLGVPLSWRKTAGDTVSWVGFELLHRSYKIGLSQRRAQRFQRWTRETADACYVHMSAFEEGLGRVMSVAGAFRIRTSVSLPSLSLSHTSSSCFSSPSPCQCCVHTLGVSNRSDHAKARFAVRMDAPGAEMV